MAEQALANLALVQASNRQADEVDRFHAEGRAIMAATLASVRLRGLLMPVVALTELIGTLIVIGLGTVALAEGRLTLGSLLVFLTFLSQLYGPVRALADLTTSLYAAAAGAERIIELLDMPTTVADPPTSVDLAGHAGASSSRASPIATLARPGTPSATSPLPSNRVDGSPWWGAAGPASPRW